MRTAALLLVFAFLLRPAFSQDTNDGPANDKAQKTYKNAFQELKAHMEMAALDDFKKADKQDGGHCLGCQRMMIKYGTEYEDWKTAALAAEEMIANAQGNQAAAVAHYQLASVHFAEGFYRQKDEPFARAHEELTKALAAYANFPDALFLDGRALAHLHQDEAAKTQFERYISLKPADDTSAQRARRYVSQPDLARARMAPAFAFTAVDGTHISMDDLQGKVVLLDFWATWCAPCREALPYIRKVARKFQGEPLVVISISVDTDRERWKEFIEKNEMTWPQFCDGGFGGSIAKTFNVHAIPHTFTIDADGVLQEEHVGDASIEGKIKKLLARAHEMPSAGKAGT